MVGGLEKELEASMVTLDGGPDALDDSFEVFVGAVCHDLRTPLQAVRGFAERLLDDYQEQLGTIGGDYALRIAKAADRMAGMIEDHLQGYRAEKRAVVLERLDLAQVVRRAAAQLEELFGERNAELAIEEPLPSVQGYAPWLQQAVHNLLANAVKYVPPESRPRVVVKAERGERSVRLWIADNGAGIAPADTRRIFAAFERVTSGWSPPGSGLGLAFAMRAVKRMGGSMGVESTPGKGSSFWIELPRTANRPALRPAAPRPGAHRARRSRSPLRRHTPKDD